jgi:hypothetical protein
MDGIWGKVDSPCLMACLVFKAADHRAHDAESPPSESVFQKAAPGSYAVDEVM